MPAGVKVSVVGRSWSRAFLSQILLLLEEVEDSLALDSWEVRREEAPLLFFSACERL